MSIVASTTATSSTTTFSPTSATTTSSNEVSTLPAPSTDPLTAMMCSGDFGSAVAAMVFSAEKHNRDAAKTARDAAYSSMEAAERDEITQMEKSSTTKLETGLTEGILDLGAAGATVRSGAFGAGSTGATQWAGLSAGAKGGATIGGAVGKFYSDQNDRNVTGAQHRADEFKRVAENHNDDVQDAGKAMDKAVQFYQDWINARNAEQAAALHRS